MDRDKPMNEGQAKRHLGDLDSDFIKLIIKKKTFPQGTQSPLENSLIKIIQKEFMSSSPAQIPCSISKHMTLI